MLSAHRRHERRNAALWAFSRCGGRVAVVAAAVVGLLGLGTVGVPASAAAAYAAQAPVVRTGPIGLVGPVADGSAPTAAAAPTAAEAPAAAAAMVVVPSAPVWSAPVPGARISEPFGAADSGYAAGYHTGTDFAADEGTPALAVGPGTVVSAGWQESYGNSVVLELPDGRYAFYGHLSAVRAQPGRRLLGGQPLGLVGSTGNSTGPHLHFEIRTADVYGAVVDPLPYLRAHGVTGY